MGVDDYQVVEGNVNLVTFWVVLMCMKEQKWLRRIVISEYNIVEFYYGVYISIL